MIRKTEVVDTSKSYEEIIRLVSSFTEGEKSWKTYYNLTKPFYRKVEGNVIYLNSFSLTFWPMVELELNKYIEPKLRIHYSGIRLFAVSYIVLFLLFIDKAFEIQTWNQGAGFLGFSLFFILIPLYINFMQKNFKEWLLGILASRDNH